MVALQPIKSIKTVFTHKTLGIGPSRELAARSWGLASPVNWHRSAQNYLVKPMTLLGRYGLPRNLGVSIMKSNEFVRPTLAKANFMDFTDIH